MLPKDTAFATLRCPFTSSFPNLKMPINLQFWVAICFLTHQSHPTTEPYTFKNLEINVGESICTRPSTNLGDNVSVSQRYHGAQILKMGFPGMVGFIGTHTGAPFSVMIESGSMMNLPLVPMQSSDRKGGCSYFGESNGSLYCIEVHDICSGGFYVYELQIGDQAWACRYLVAVSGLLREFREIRQQTKQRGYDETVFAYSILHVGKIFGAEEGGGEEDVSMLLAIPGKVISYNFASKKVKVLRDLPGEVLEPFNYSSFTSFAFMESLHAV